MSAPAPPPPPGTGSARLVPTVRPGRGGLGRCRALAGRAIELPRGGRGWDPGELQGVPCPPPTQLSCINPPPPLPQSPRRCLLQPGGGERPFKLRRALGAAGLGDGGCGRKAALGRSAQVRGCVRRGAPGSRGALWSSGDSGEPGGGEEPRGAVEFGGRRGAGGRWGVRGALGWARAAGSLLQGSRGLPGLRLSALPPASL